VARALRIWLLLAALALAATLAALLSGSGAIPAGDVLRVLVQPDASAASEIVHQLRLPRALAGLATGALLGVAGALMQILLRNPLADPYVLGLSGGAATGALGAMVAGAGVAGAHAGAFTGALASMGIVLAFAHRDLGDLGRLDAPGTLDASPRLLLTGVVLAAGWTAAVTLLLTLSPEEQLRGMLFWLMGDVSASASFVPALVAVPVVLALVLPFARDCNVLLQGPAVAHALGVRVTRVRTVAFVAAAVAAAVAVMTAGAVGFVGLVVPHALRLACGNDQRVLLPASALAGGALLVAADTAARTVMSPLQLPVGVITAFLGVPAFLFLLSRRTTR
jgi:iron complex transport system permease protein